MVLYVTNTLDDNHMPHGKFVVSPRTLRKDTLHLAPVTPTPVSPGV